MALLWKKVQHYYQYINDDLSDPRTSYLPLTNSPWLPILILVLYYKFVFQWGPRFMKNREPFHLKNVIIAYNLFQISVSAFLFIEGIRLVYWDYYSIKCEPISYEDTPRDRAIVFRIWIYYMMKIIDLLDTVFFVLRKKQNQVTFLHTYHHISMVALCYFGTKYVAGGHGIMMGIVNSLVHAVMYTYYLLTTINSEYSKNIWWKKYLTQLQIIQFLWLNIHFTHILFRPSCTYPKWVALLNVPQNNVILYMFVNFYIKNYIQKKKA